MINTPKRIGHPTPKPLDVLVYILDMFEGEVVPDPFLGSGTTLLACRLTGRNGIGYEINPDYEPIIKKRIMEDIPDLFTYAEDVEGVYPKKETA